MQELLVRRIVLLGVHADGDRDGPADRGGDQQGRRAPAAGSDGDGGAHVAPGTQGGHSTTMGRARGAALEERLTICWRRPRQSAVQGSRRRQWVGGGGGRCRRIGGASAGGSSGSIVLYRGRVRGRGGRSAGAPRRPRRGPGSPAGPSGRRRPAVAGRDPHRRRGAASPGGAGRPQPAPGRAGRSARPAAGASAGAASAAVTSGAGRVRSLRRPRVSDRRTAFVDAALSASRARSCASCSFSAASRAASSARAASASRSVSASSARAVASCSRSASRRAASARRASSARRTSAASAAPLLQRDASARVGLLRRAPPRAGASARRASPPAGPPASAPSPPPAGRPRPAEPPPPAGPPRPDGPSRPRPAPPSYSLASSAWRASSCRRACSAASRAASAASRFGLRVTGCLGGAVLRSVVEGGLGDQRLLGEARLLGAPVLTVGARTLVVGCGPRRGASGLDGAELVVELRPPCREPCRFGRSVIRGALHHHGAAGLRRVEARRRDGPALLLGRHLGVQLGLLGVDARDLFGSGEQAGCREPRPLGFELLVLRRAVVRGAPDQFVEVCSLGGHARVLVATGVLGLLGHLLQAVPLRRELRRLGRQARFLLLARHLDEPGLLGDPCGLLGEARLARCQGGELGRVDLLDRHERGDTAGVLGVGRVARRPGLQLSELVAQTSLLGAPSILDAARLGRQSRHLLRPARRRGEAVDRRRVGAARRARRPLPALAVQPGARRGRRIAATSGGGSGDPSALATRARAARRAAAARAGATAHHEPRSRTPRRRRGPVARRGAPAPRCSSRPTTTSSADEGHGRGGRGRHDRGSGHRGGRRRRRRAPGSDHWSATRGRGDRATAGAAMSSGVV